MWAVSRRRRRAWVLRGQAGFTFVKLVASATVLALMATTVLGGLLYGMTEARRGKLRAEAAAWVQAELDYLRVQGYSFLADDVAAGARTLTQSGVSPPSGALAEPRIPAGFDRAVIRAEDVAAPPLRKLTVTLYETPDSPPYTILSTYVANFSTP